MAVDIDAAIGNYVQQYPGEHDWNEMIFMAARMSHAPSQRLDVIL